MTTEPDELDGTDDQSGIANPMGLEKREAWEASRKKRGWDQLVDEALADVESRLRRFESCGDGTGTELAEAYAVDGGKPLTLCLVIRPYKIDEGGYTRGIRTVTRHELRLLGLLELPREAGQALIRPESLSDKIVEAFKPKEVDFHESPVFSKRYYVLATDEPALRSTIKPPALDVLGSRADLFAEISGRDLIVAWPSVPSLETLDEPVSFFAELANAVGLAPSAPYR